MCHTNQNKTLGFVNLWKIGGEIEMYFRVVGVFWLYIDVLSVSMRFSVIFCIYEHVLKLNY